MQVRFAKDADIPALATLEYQHYKAEGYPEAFLFQALRQWPRMLWVAEDYEIPCGYVLAAPGENQRQAWIMSALISADYRGQGLGSLLMQHALDELSATGITNIYLSVAPENSGARKLYEKLGFTISDRKNDYLGAGEHRLIMCFKACSSRT